VLPQRVGELLPAAGVLVLELDACGALGVALGHLGRALGAERLGHHVRLGAERLLALGLRAVAAARDHQRTYPVRVAQAQVQRAEPAHGEPDDVGTIDPGGVQHGDRVGDGPRLGVGLEVARNVGRRIAAGGVGDAPVAPAEGAELRLPAAMVAGELVDEQEWRPPPPPPPRQDGLRHRSLPRS
jgi:hypothetical protein